MTRQWILMKKIMCGNILTGYCRAKTKMPPMIGCNLQYQLANMPGSTFLLKSSV